MEVMRMFTMEELLSRRNQRMAFEYLEHKKNGVGSYDMSIEVFKEYWEMNHERIENELRTVGYALF
jgi:hypothetical protein